MNTRSWQFYQDIFSKMLKKVPHFSLGLESPIDFLTLMNSIDHNVSDGIRVSFSDIHQVPQLVDEVLHFHCGTVSNWPKYLHAVRIIEVQNDRQLPLVVSKWILNREIDVFATVILGFIQGLVRYAFRQESFAQLASNFGVPVRFLPASFGWELENWEEQLKVPELGTSDIIGSFMYHIWKGTLSVDD
ncbi:MAG: hypothetical protein ACTSWA_11885 [Candidatus Thorarchaeota archaeon]